MVEAFQNFLDKAEIETQNQIEVRLIELLKEKHLTLALAESLTGGMISSRITSVPGSSEYFIGSVVCYHPRIKVQYCGVDAKSISQFGAVSEVVAREMAVSVRTLQKRLEEEGVVFSDLLREVRQHLAQKYLRENYSVEQITYLLGFSEPSVFRKAFKKWAGITPREYREGMYASRQQT